MDLHDASHENVFQDRAHWNAIVASRDPDMHCLRQSLPHDVAGDGVPALRKLIV